MVLEEVMTDHKVVVDDRRSLFGLGLSPCLCPAQVALKHVMDQITSAFSAKIRGERP